MNWFYIYTERDPLYQRIINLTHVTSIGYEHGSWRIRMADGEYYDIYPEEFERIERALMPFNSPTVGIHPVLNGDASIDPDEFIGTMEEDLAVRS